LALVLAHLVRLLPRERAALGALALRLLVAGAVGWVAMVACWPWAHEAPVANPLRAILQATDFDRVYPVLYAGRHFPSDALPRHYLPVYLLITTPLPLLALAALGAVAEIRRARADADPARRFALGLTLVWLALPVALVIALGPNLYDGMRHFLFVLPAIAVLAGLGAWHAATRLSAGRLGRGAWLVVGLVVLSPLVSMARLHPYQTSYFNAFVGGLSGAEGRFEVDYWATSLREATEFVNAHAPATTQARGRPVRLLVGTTSPYPKIAVEYAAVAGIEVLTLAELARWSGEPPAIDYYVAPDRYGMQGFFDAAPIVHRVRRDGVTLAVVRDMGGAPVRPTSAPAEVGTGPSGSAHRAD